MNAKTAAMMGATMAMLGVILGAFGAHALKASLDVGAMAVYQKASQYHFIHSIALLVLGGVWQGLSNDAVSTRRFRAAAWLFALGLLLFCGSLYALSVTQIKPLGMVTPIGGVAFILAWCFTVLGLRSASWKSENKSE